MLQVLVLLLILSSCLSFVPPGPNEIPNSAIECPGLVNGDFEQSNSLVGWMKQEFGAGPFNFQVQSNGNSNDPEDLVNPSGIVSKQNTSFIKY